MPGSDPFRLEVAMEEWRTQKRREIGLHAHITVAEEAEGKIPDIGNSGCGSASDIGRTCRRTPWISSNAIALNAPKSWRDFFGNHNWPPSRVPSEWGNRRY